MFIVSPIFAVVSNPRVGGVGKLRTNQVGHLENVLIGLRNKFTGGGIFGRNLVFWFI